MRTISARLACAAFGYRALIHTAALCAAVLVLPNAAAAATETQIYAFKSAGSGDAYSPEWGLTSDAEGNLYGTSRQGGVGLGLGSGTIYQLKPPAPGKSAWTESVVWNFQGGTKGKWPEAPLVLGPDGKLYGTTISGGDLTDCGNQGCGTVFSFAPPLPGKKVGKFTIIHRFHHKAGSSPTGALTFDSDGNLYGATMYGGGDNYCTGDLGGCGVIFKLAPPDPGKVAWKPSVIHAFYHQTGAVPNGGLVFDASQNVLYGTAQGGGGGKKHVGNGVVFAMTRPMSNSGAWPYAAIYAFQGATKSDGNWPNAGVTFDASGNLYGTTLYGGDVNCGGGCGTIFKLSLVAGTWQESVLHIFEGDTHDGRNAYSGLTYDGQALYGTTRYGGADAGGLGSGTVYKMALGPSPSFSLLYSFRNNGTDGIAPEEAKLLWDGANKFYGVTLAGGPPFSGIVYSITVP